LAQVNKHSGGDRLFSVAGGTSQDNRTALRERETDIVKLIWCHERVLHRLCLAPGQPAEPDHFYLTDKEDVPIAPGRVAFSGQTVRFSQVLITQGALTGARDRLCRDLA
jgi:hypothetical protein